MEQFKYTFYLTLGATFGLGFGLVLTIFVAKILW